MMKLKKNGVLSIALPNDPGFLWRFGRFFLKLFSLKKKLNITNLEYDYMIASEHINSIFSSAPHTGSSSCCMRKLQHTFFRISGCSTKQEKSVLKNRSCFRTDFLKKRTDFLENIKSIFEI